jgi:hypothetical protein
LITIIEYIYTAAVCVANKQILEARDVADGPGLQQIGPEDPVKANKPITDHD